MPTYQYVCTECGGQVEVVQKFSDDPLTVHDECGGRLRKVFSPVGIVFKGSGFYRTDSRSGSSAAASSSDSSGEKSEKSDGAKSDSSSSSSSDSGSSSSSKSAEKPAKSDGAKTSSSSSSSGSSSSGEKVA